MDLEQLRELIQVFESADIAEIEIEEEGRRICLKKAAATVVAPVPGLPQAAPVPMPGYEQYVSTAPRAPQPPPASSGGAPTDAGKSGEAEAPDGDDGLVTIDSPIVGVFYEAPAPGEPPYVSQGDEVDEGQTICIVEAMKLMNEIAAEFPCVVERVLVENAEPVEFGQPLFSVRPLNAD